MLYGCDFPKCNDDLEPDCSIIYTNARSWRVERYAEIERCRRIESDREIAEREAALEDVDSDDDDYIRGLQVLQAVLRGKLKRSIRALGREFPKPSAGSNSART